MKILNVTQGSPEWLATRMQCNCASDAPAMMGTSKLMTRAELVRMKALGLEKEFTEWERRYLLERGHQVEAYARAYAEELLGEDLFPVTATDDSGMLLASFDGLPMGGKIGFEAKLWNEELAASVRAGHVPPTHSPQLDHQGIVGGLEKILFVVTDGTPERTIHCEYFPEPAAAKALMDGWKQFDEDVRNYKHTEVIEAPRGRTLPALPYLDLEVSGQVQRSNLAEYRSTALAAIDSINTALTTDQDFADAAENVKFCADAEAKLEAAKELALSRTRSVKEAFELLDELREAFRQRRLTLDKLVTKRKESIRAEILREGQGALVAHIAQLNERICPGRAFMPNIAADFAGAMKGKKTIQSLRDAVDGELAKAKILASSIADTISINLRVVEQEAANLEFLFADLGIVVTKPKDDFAMLVKVRIAEHRKREEEFIQREAAARLATTPAVVPAAPAVSPSPNVVALPKSRPSDAAIITALCVHFRATETEVVDWLLGMDLHAALAKTATAGA